MQHGGPTCPTWSLQWQKREKRKGRHVKYIQLKDHLKWIYNCREKLSAHTSCNRHHCFGVVCAVYVEATDVFCGGNNCKRLKLFTAGAIIRWVEACGTCAGLVIFWFGQTQVRTASIVRAAGIGTSCWIWGSQKGKKMSENFTKNNNDRIMCRKSTTYCLWRAL